MKGVLLFVVPVTALLATTLSAARDKTTLPIARISVQRVLVQSTDSKAAARMIEAARQARNKEGADRQKQLESTHRQVVEAGGVFQAAKRANLKADEERQRTELQQFTSRAQTEIQEIQRQAQASLQQKMTAAVQEVAASRGVEMVLNSDTALVWAPTMADFTADVIAKMNAASRPEQAPK